MKRNLICIVCPIGCEMEVTIDENGIINVVGNNCPRGQKYALTECENPERVITTTILCNNGKVLPVKTSRPIPKDKTPKRKVYFSFNLFAKLKPKSWKRA